MLRLATVGTSMITERFLNAVDVTEGITPYGVFSRSIEKAKAIGEPHGVAVFYTSYEQLLADDNVDIVYIGSPNSLHFGYAMAAVEAGKAVICEKPFVSNMAEFYELKHKAEEKRAFVFEAITSISMPNMARLREGLREIAPIHLAKIDYSQFSSRFPLLQAGERSNIFSTEFSGGALYDLGVYPAHLAIALFGEPKQVAAFCNSEKFGVDTSGAVMLKYDDLVCTLTFSKDSYSAVNTEFQGEGGYVTVTGSTGRIMNIMLTNTAGQTKNIGVEQDENPMIYEAAAFVKIIEEDDFESVRKAFAQSEGVMKLLCDARKAAGIVFAADKKL